MTRMICTVVVCGLTLAGCTSQPPQDESADGKALPAPVREASIVAVETPDPILVENEPSVEVTEGGDANSGAAIALENPPLLVGEEPVSDLDVASEQVSDTVSEPVSAAPIIESAPVESTPPESTLEEAGATPTEVEGLVQLELPKDEVVVAADDEGTESDVATYLLDEAENSFQRQNYEKARGQSERALALEPTAGRAYLILARVELAERRPDQAAEIARKGLASITDSDEIFEQLNQILGQVAEMPPATSSGSATQESISQEPTIQEPAPSAVPSSEAMSESTSPL